MKEFDAFEDAGTFARTKKYPEGSNIVDAWLYKWKGDYHGRVDRPTSVEWLWSIASKRG